MDSKGMISKSYFYFDHEADMGIEGWGKTLEEAFQNGAQGMLDLVCEHEGQGLEVLDLGVSSNDLDGLYVEFLNGLLAEMDIQEIYISECVVKNIAKTKTGYSLVGRARYVPRSENILKKSEVKAATYCELAVKSEREKYIVRCVVDI